MHIGILKIVSTFRCFSTLTISIMKATLMFLGLVICPLFSVYSQNERFVSIGGSLTYGFRDGSVSRESQETSYVSLLANQLNIKNFKQADLGEGLFRKTTASLDNRNDLTINGGFFSADVKKESGKLRVVELTILLYLFKKC